MRNLTREDALMARRAAHLLGGSDLTPAQVVDRAVALQGQDLAGVLRAIAMRSRPGTTIADVREAFDRGEIVRSWPVRGTLFATTPVHLSALLSLTSERIHRATAKRRAELGLDEATLAAAHEVGARLIAGGAGPTRAELLDAWEAEGIPTTGGRGYHLIFHHAVAGGWHWGAFRGEEQSLAALGAVDVAADPLPGLVRRLVAARAPMTDDDLAWWLKLPKTQVRRAVAAAGLTPVMVEGVPAWVADDVPGAAEEEAAPRERIDFAPAFDEWILGYADRSLTASPRMLRAIVPGNNGVFKSTVIVDGTVVGTWQGLSKARRAATFDLTETVGARAERRIAARLREWPLA